VGFDVHDATSVDARDLREDVPTSRRGRSDARRVTRSDSRVKREGAGDGEPTSTLEFGYIRTRSMRARLLSIAVVIVASSARSIVPAVAHADPTAGEIAAARELFRQGLELEDKGQWSDALATFQRVAAVKKSAAVQFHLALCLEKTGHLVDALNGFTSARSIAASEATPDAQTVDASSSKHLEALDVRIPHVQIVWPIAGVTATVSIDGVDVSPALLGAPIPLDPGRHRVVVTAPGYERYEHVLTLAEAAPTERLVVRATAASAYHDEGPKTAPLEGGHGAGPWILLGGGALSLGAAGLFYALRGSTISDLQGLCGDGGTHCPPDKQSEYDQGKTYTWLGNVTLVAGIAAAGGALVWLALPSGGATTTPTVGVAATPAGWSLTLRGAF
jgi:hypothetical protein